MAFSLLFREGGSSGAARGDRLPIDLLHRAECLACPLNHAPGMRHPKMSATGDERADIFFISEAPGQREDEQGRALVGPAGRVLRMRVPEAYLPRIRWGNVLRCRPPKGRDPTPTELECCRPSVQRQVILSKPRAVVGFGNQALTWATGQSGINKWRGRRLPVRIGDHACWFFPIAHPSDIMRGRKFEPSRDSEYGSDEELAFAFDVRRALEAIDDALPVPVIHDREDAERGVTWITGHRGRADFETLRAALERAARADATGVDLETTGRRPYKEGSKILTAAVSWGDETIAFPIDHSGAGWTRAQRDAVLNLFVIFLRRARGPKSVFNLAFEMEWFAELVSTELLRAGDWDCSMIQAHVLDERSKMGKPDAISLEFLCLQYFGINIKALSHLNKDKLDEEPLEAVLRYNGIDARYHLLLHEAQIERLRAEEMYETYRDRVRHVPTLILTQVQGQPVDSRVVKMLDDEYSSRMRQFAAEIAAQPLARKYQARYGKPFRPSANDDVKALLKMAGLHVDSADVEAVTQLNDPMREPLMGWKKAAKTHSTYVVPMRDKRWPDALIHSQISLTSVDTGRTASEEPNSQNYPKRNEEYRRVRAQISALAWQEHLKEIGHPDAEYEHAIVSFDWGQIQARNIAMESLDKKFLQMLWDEYEIHGHWRDRLWQIYPQWRNAESEAQSSDDKRLKSYRNVAKNGFVFPSLFGAGVGNVATGLGVPENIAQKLQEEFWDVFRGVKKWHESKHQQVRDCGYVSGLSGLRRRAPLSPNKIINSPIQADETVIVLDAMTRCSQAGLQAILEVHDDLTFCWPKHRIDEYAEVALDIMMTPTYEWARVVPIVVEMAVGPDWANLKDAGVFSSARWS
jgi:uracil-DNA glycosylase family 4